MRVLGWPAAVILAAVAHTAYKMALFAWPPIAISIDYPFVALWTIAGGVIFGQTRDFYAIVIPSSLHPLAT